MAPPLKSFMANERTYLEWIDMAITIGAVASGLLALGNAPTQAVQAANSARVIGLLLMPISIAFTIYSGLLFQFRRKLLRVDDLYNAQMHDTKIPLILGYVLFFSLCAVFVIDVLGGVVHV